MPNFGNSAAIAQHAETKVFIGLVPKMPFCVGANYATHLV
jgi:hypothetical protein